MRSTGSWNGGSPTSTLFVGESSSTWARAEIIDLKFRLGQTLETHLDDAAGALENYREILFLDARHDGRATAPREDARMEICRADAAAILEAIYEERADWEKLIGVLEILRRRRGERREARPAAKRRPRASQATT